MECHFSEYRDKCSYIGHIFINITTVPEGREWFAKTTADDWELLSAQSRIPSRRPIVLQVVKNICCDPDMLRKINYENTPIVQLLGRIVYPPAETVAALDSSLPSEQRSSDGGFVHPSIKVTSIVIGRNDCTVQDRAFGLVNDLYSRRLVAECWIGLLGEARAREFCRRLGVYDVLRMWHLMETDRDILSTCEDIVHLVHFSEEELAEQDAALIVRPRSKGGDFGAQSE